MANPPDVKIPRPGTLFVVATPIGNLDDLSPRAREAIARAAVVICEDTRRTARLLGRFDIAARTVSCHKFNERGRIDDVLARLAVGEDVALLSDGGTPGISDPGAVVVAAVLERGLPVSPVPGPSAAVAILSVSGFPADRFVFEGFLPHRASDRRARLRELVDDPRTIVAFDSPLRVLDTLEDLDAVFGERAVVLGRELTKLHETVVRGSAVELIGHLSATLPVRGEIVLAIAGSRGTAAGGRDAEEREALRAKWREALDAASGDRREALRALARELGARRAALWRRLVEARVVEEADT